MEERVFPDAVRNFYLLNTMIDLGMTTVATMVLNTRTGIHMPILELEHSLLLQSATTEDERTAIRTTNVQHSPRFAR